MDLRTNLKINGAPRACGRAATRAPRAIALALLGPALLLSAGCRGRTTAEAEAAAPPKPASAPFTLVGGTPAGGLRDWIGDVRQGLGGIPAEAARDEASAQRAALELYLTRQEYIEMYWGVAGKLTRGTTLGPAVKEAETRFHLVLAELQPGKKPQPAVLEREIASLGEQYDRVIAAAEQAGVPLDPHALVPAAPAAGPAHGGAAR